MAPTQNYGESQTTIAMETIQSSEREGEFEREAFLKKGIQLSTKWPQHEQ